MAGGADRENNGGAHLSALVKAVENMQLGVTVTDASGNIIYANTAEARAHGYTPEELIGRDVRIFAPEDRWNPMDTARLKEMGSWSRDSVNVRKDGSRFPVRIMSDVIFDPDGAPLAVVSTCEDITERSHKEEELSKYRTMLEEMVNERTSELKEINDRLLREVRERERMEAELLEAKKFESIGVLAGGIAHDYNNILTSVLGNLYLAKMNAKPEKKVYELIVETEMAALRAKDLTRQLLSFSSGASPNKKTLSIAKVLKDSIGHTLSGYNVRYDFDLPDDLWPVEADLEQMLLVFRHLAVNARDAMPEGGSIHISAENVRAGLKETLPLKGSDYVVLSVKDMGVGIPREHLHRIFDPYFSTKKIGTQKGMGLGLAICYSIIRNHNGLIEAESEPGDGTTFRVWLPASAPKVEAAPSEAVSKGRVLVVDDEELVRNIARKMLEHIGYECDMAEEGEKALMMYEERLNAGSPYDVVIMDLTIPGGMGGKEAIERMVKMDPGARAVVSSGYSDDPAIADYRDYGFRAALVKPYTVDDIEKAIKAATL